MSELAYASNAMNSFNRKLISGCGAMVGAFGFSWDEIHKNALMEKGIFHSSRPVIEEVISISTKG